MEYRNLGHSGLKVSSLCVGTMTWGESTDQAEADRIVAEAIERGVNFFDTANQYGDGQSERILGRAIARADKRDEIVLATKVTAPMGPGVNEGGSSRYHVMRECERQLERLGTDHIDLYQLHFADFSTPLEEALGALDDLVRQGKVRYIGSSKFVPAYLVEAIMTSLHRGWERFISEQPPYNLLDRGVENELVWTCMRHGLGIIPWAPLATGILTGQYATAENLPNGRQISGRRLTQEAVARASALAPLARDRGLTLAQFSLAWLCGRPGVTAPTLGVRKVEHLVSALEGIEARLTDEELARIDEIVPPGSAVSDYWDQNVHRYMRHAIEAGK